MGYAVAVASSRSGGGGRGVAAPGISASSAGK